MSELPSANEADYYGVRAPERGVSKGLARILPHCHLAGAAWPRPSSLIPGAGPIRKWRRSWESIWEPCTSISAAFGLGTLRSMPLSGRRGLGN